MQPGNQRLVHRVRLHALDRLDADDALVLGLVRQHRRARDIADGVNAGHIGLAVAVDHDGAALGLHAELLQPEILDIADDADGRDDALDLICCVPPLPSSIVAATVSPSCRASSPWRRS